MNEKQLQFFWEHGLCLPGSIDLCTGTTVEVIDSGVMNHDSGPDFINARVRIGGMVLVGCIEVHIKASDWFLHGHQNDKAYNNVILHVVYEYDTHVFPPDGLRIPTVLMNINPQSLLNYNQLDEVLSPNPCHGIISPLSLSKKLEAVFEEKMEVNIAIWKERLTGLKNDWEQVLLEMLCRSFGMNVNSLPFELLAKRVPYSLIRRLGTDRFAIESLLLGGAGLLEGSSLNDEYCIKLYSEFNFLQSKYTIEPMQQHLWKRMRTRPVNFPEVRISQLAALLSASNRLINIIDEPAKVLSNISASKYWDTRFSFGSSEHPPVKKNLGDVAMQSILCNSVYPFQYFYGLLHGNQTLCSKALAEFRSMPAEKNRIVARWLKAGYKIRNSLESQAVIYLDKAYCSKRKCNECKISKNLVQSYDELQNTKN